MSVSRAVGTLDLWLAGRAVEAADGRRYRLDNPFSGQPVVDAALGGRVEAEASIEAAAKAFPLWSGLSGNDRANRLQRAYSTLLQARGDLAALLVAEQGKTAREADKEIRSTGAFLRFYAEEARRIGGRVVASPDTDKRVLAIRQPVGVVAALTAANFPGIMFGRKVAPALAAGCTVVLKPAEEAPSLAVALAAILQDAGIPDGVLNVVFGDAPAIAAAIMNDPRVRLVTFTGSVARGKQLMADAAPGLKRLVLELGGVAPFLVFDDADLAAAAEGLVQAKFRHAGQVCASPQRVLVQDSIRARFIPILLDAVRALQVGDPADRATDFGPVQNSRIASQVRDLVRDAVAKGAELLVDGTAGHGLMLGATVLTGITSTMLVASEEAFGPVVAIETFATDEEAFGLANATSYGLGAYVYTQGLRRAWIAAEKLEAGVVGVNDPFPATIEGPFGGVKQSGFGLEGGRYGIDEFLLTKQVSFRI